MPIDLPFLPDSQGPSIAVMGCKGVGKSSIIRCIVADPLVRLFSICNTSIGTEYKTLIGKVSMDITEVPLIDNVNVAMPLDAHITTKMFDAFILVFSVDDMSSYNGMEMLKDLIVQSDSGDVPIVVVGNKTDLKTREVSYELADCMVSIDWELRYTETSATARDNVSTILSSLLRHRRLDHYRFPSLIKKQSAMLPVEMSRRMTMTSPTSEGYEDAGERERANSDSLGCKRKKQNAKNRARQTKAPFLKDNDTLNKRTNSNKFLALYRPILTDYTENEHPSLHLKKLREHTLRLPSEGISFSCNISDCSTDVSPVTEKPHSLLRFTLEKEKRSSLGSSVCSDPTASLLMNLNSEPMRQRCHSSCVRRPLKEDVLTCRRVSFSDCVEKNSDLDEKTSWISAVIRFLRK